MSSSLPEGTKFLPAVNRLKHQMQQENASEVYSSWNQDSLTATEGFSRCR